MRMKSVFSTITHRDGWHRVVASPGQKMTFLVCECETQELAEFLVSELNNQPEAIRSQLSLSSSYSDNNDEVDDLLFYRMVKSA